MPKIIVFGSGAMGLAWSGLFALGDYGSCTLVSRGESYAEVKERGLQITGKLKCQLQVRVVDTLPELDERRIVLVCVKAYDLPSALAAIRDSTVGNVDLVFLQNGLFIQQHVRDIWDGLAEPDGRVKKPGFVRMVTSLGATKTSPNTVNISGLGRTFIQASQAGQQIMAALHQADLDVQLTDEIELQEVKKGIANSVINPLSTLLDIKNGELLADGQAMAMMRRLVEEDVAVLRAAGFELSVREELANIYRILQDTGENYSSMLQDRRAGRKTEKDFLIGQIVTLAGEYGIPVPFNKEILQKLS